jgi:hypothetical protein
MRTTDIFKFNRSAHRLNESLQKTFGSRINFEKFNTTQLEDARNKLRTQIHSARQTSGFNETIENETLTKAQFMHDAIVAELMDREEHIVDNTVQEGPDFDKQAVMDILKKFDENMNERGGYGDPDTAKILASLSQGDVESAVDEVWNAYSDQDGGEIDMDDYIEDLEYEFKEIVGGSDDEGGDTDDGYALASAGFGSDEDYGDFPESIAMERDRDPEDWDEGNTEPPNNFAVSINGKKWKVFKGRGRFADDYKEKEHYRQLQNWAQAKSQSTGKKWTVSITGENPTESIEQNESINTGEDMRNLREGEIQQASAIVTAKTMVDRVGRWIEELSGMENDTLLQLGDSIRDEMGQEQAKGFIEAVAPAIQSALENLKTTREALASGVRTLTGEEQPANMLGAEPEAATDEFGGEAEPDAMNAGGELDMGPEEPTGDEFGAADAAVGGAETAGREKRESIYFSNRLMKVLAG